MWDTHVHSIFSHDGKSGMEEYTALIDNEQLEGIGFTEHVDFLPECGGYGRFDYNRYKASADEFKQKGYSFHAGAEIDYAKRAEPLIVDYLAAHSFDYTIVSVHMIDSLSVSDGRNVECYRDRNTLLHMLEGYYNEVNNSLKVPEFDVIGHAGIFRRYLTRDYFCDASIKKWIAEVDMELITACAKADKILEVNSSGLFSPSSDTFPGVYFIKEYYNHGGRKISLGSDAHRVLDVGRGFGEVKEILNKIGFKYLVLPWDKEKTIII